MRKIVQSRQLSLKRDMPKSSWRSGSDRAVGRNFNSNPAPFHCSRDEYLRFEARAARLAYCCSARNALVQAAEDHNELVLYPKMEIH